MAATGLPGTPKTRVRPRTPKARGLPGLVATPQKRRSTPSSSCTCLTKSNSPTDTPPLVSTTSCSRAAAMSRRVSSRSSRAMPSRTGSAPAARTCPYAVYEFELRICPGPTGWPTGTSSLPVARIATRGRLVTGTGSAPTEARRPISAGPRRAPRGKTTSPTATSSPARRTLAPGLTASRTVSVSPAWLVSSTGTTVSTPGGRGAPVMILAASPGPTGSATWRPAGISTDTRYDRAAGAELVTAQRVAVHRGVVEGRDLLARDDVGGGGAAEGVEQRDLLRGERDDGRQDAVDGLLYGEQGTHHLRSLNCLRLLVNSGNRPSDTQSEAAEGVQG